MKLTKTQLASIFTASLLTVSSLTTASPIYGEASSNTVSPISASTSGEHARNDLEGHWAEHAVHTWMLRGVVNGYANQAFEPNRAITRAEFITVINRLFGFSHRSEQAFSDVPSNAWYADQLSYAREAGYYLGFPNNEARAAQAIARQDAAALLARVYQLQAADRASFAASFQDSDAISPYAVDAINALQNILSGYSDGTLRPQSLLTRAETVALIDKLTTAYFYKEGSYEGGAINGNAIIHAGGVQLHDASITRNLYITSGAGNQEVSLERIAVKGQTFIAGGGAHAITIKDSSFDGVMVNAPLALRFTGSGSSTLGSLTIGQSGSLQVSGPGSINRIVITAASALVNGTSYPAGQYRYSDGKLEPLNEDGTTGTTGGSTGGSSSGGSGGSSNNGGNVRSENFVDANATARTKALFAYLADIRGKGILFGQQHSTDVGFTIDPSLSTPQSDVNKAVGDFPAVFGWDTLSLEGKEVPGVLNNREQSRLNLTREAKEAHQMGGIITLSAHMPNFVTGGSFNDTAGSVVEHILPGGDKNGAYNDYLDMIADFALQLKDDQGAEIPIMFRPLHEQNGSWFWWGAAWTPTDQYIELFRYTVEYLRDIKHVHNMLYVYSPNGTFGGSESNYLTTYPGDDYVDILGMDQYDNQSAPGTQAFFNNLTADLAMINKLADRKHKIATFSEFGYSPSGMKTTGNGDLAWFTKLLQAIKSDPDASRIAYMQTWANFNLDGNLFVPYKAAPGLGDHELLPDFIAYYQDPYTLFRGELSGVYSQTVTAAAEQPFFHIASPANMSTISEPTTRVRARVLNQTPTKVTYLVDGSSTEEIMLPDADGYYSASWSPEARLNGKNVGITVKVYAADGTVAEQRAAAFVRVSELLMKTISFDQDIVDVKSNGAYPSSISTTLSHSTLNGDGALRIDTSGLDAADTWQELKLELNDIASSVSLADVNRVKFDAWVPTSAGAGNPDASLRGIVMLPPDWNTKYGETTTLRKLSELDKQTIDGVEYAKYSVSIDLNQASASASATGLAFSLVGSGLASAQGNLAIYIDNVKLYSAYVQAPLNPAIVDHFEYYAGSNDSLNLAIRHAGGDATALSLVPSISGTGTYAMKYEYTLAGSGYAGVTKSLGGVNWSTFNQLSFWYKPDGQNQKLVIQLKVDGKYFEYYPSAAGTTASLLNIPFNDFVPVHGATGTLTKTNLKNVEQFSIYTNSVGGAMLQSAMVFDDIGAEFDSAAGTVPNGGTGSGSSAAQPGTLYDFESDAAGWELGGNTASAAAPASVAGDAALGAHALQTAFDLAGTSFDVKKTAALDLSAVDTISAKVKLSTGTADARFYIKTGAGWSWYDSGASTVDASGFMTLSLPLAGVADRDDVREIGVTLDKFMGSGAAILYVDNVLLESASVPAATVFDFESSVENWSINTDNNGAYNTANASQLSFTTDQAALNTHSLQALFELNGGTFHLQHIGIADLSGSTALTAKVKVVPAAGASLGSGVQAKLFIKTGSGWTWHDSGLTAVSDSGFATVTLPLSGIVDLATTQAIGLQIVAPSGTGEATVYVDEVKY
ncbi:Mannan endo-1,4-beta-mannosidase [Paenibacillus curdlanolyticus YK9]|uniref:Mannan endo-1,4-beta-mannosidase n=1 Tax=Paenibacillus curdlanolyticus YK9 TaxID=717606 RepID=E0I6M7_9BACL|nr:glycosyl hydrolase [Paenibacillus curdlanolyticus]EFM11693.1 Mannan endo-1,4-beta-mannosidase [Paenibacillus curdlanolyticus YK9]